MVVKVSTMPRQHLRYVRIILLITALFVLYPVSAKHSSELVLTPDEQAWLEAHPVIRVAADPSSPPFEEISEQGQYQGISAELITMIEAQLGVRFEILPARDWAHVLDMVRTHEADLIPAVVKSTGREAFLSFTRPYLSLPGVIISAQQFDRLEDLEGHKVAVVAGGIWDERISQYDDRVSIIRVEDTRTALELTALGGVDAMVSNLATITYLISQQGITNLNVVAHVPNKLELSFGIRKDWEPLLPILNKALDNIPAEKIETIKSQWIDVRHPGLHISPLFWYLSFGGMAILILILAGVIAWNRSLKHRVDQRSRELEWAQAKLAHAEKMESIGALALGVAHEVKNPLAILQMGLDFIAGDTKKDETEKAIIRDMGDALHRADTIVQSLQIFSRQKDLAMTKDDINRVLLEAVEEYKPELIEHDIQLITQLDQDLPKLSMDFELLLKAFGHLIHNAILAMDQGGTLEIESSRVLLCTDDIAGDLTGAFHAGEAVIRVRIADTGPGIDTALIKKVFDPFYTTRAQGEGTGLGLSLTQNIVKLHNGLINLRNRDSGGLSVVTLFKIYEGETND
jgi:signal transduction histidine kinase